MSIKGYSMNAYTHVPNLPWHIELRKDNGVQPILFETDIWAKDDNAAFRIGLETVQGYKAHLAPDFKIILVVTETETSTCFYQNVEGQGF